MSIEMVFSGSADQWGMSLLRQAADQCAANGGDWYSSEQVHAALGEFVGRPALPLDATFISLATPERVQALMARYAALANAALAYDRAIRSAANDPAQMASFCTAQGETLDTLYARWLSLAAQAAENGEVRS